MSYRAFRYRIYPTVEQADWLRQVADASRFVYNLAVEQRRDWWRQFRAAHGRPISWASQSLEVTELRKEVDWLAAVPRSPLEQALRDVDAAFVAFFGGRARFPGFRAKLSGRRFRVQGRNANVERCNRKWGLLRLQKCSPIKVRLTRDLPGAIKNVTIAETALGWFVSFASERTGEVALTTGAPVGIDRGVANTISLSNGEHFSMVDLSIAERSRGDQQKRLARCERGSVRRARQRARLAKASARVAAIRNHWLHERSADIANRFAVVALEALRIQSMTASASGTAAEPGRNVRQKAGLNRSILEQGWGRFAAMLEYKVAERGGQVFYVDPAYTSQTCSECGSVARENRKSQAVFHCVDCGHRAHADTNAAINILRRSPAGVEGAGYGPVEARTGEMLTHLENLAA